MRNRNAYGHRFEGPLATTAHAWCQRVTPKLYALTAITAQKLLTARTAGFVEVALARERTMGCHLSKECRWSFHASQKVKLTSICCGNAWMKQGVCWFSSSVHSLVWVDRSYCTSKSNQSRVSWSHITARNIEHVYGMSPERRIALELEYAQKVIELTFCSVTVAMKEDARCLNSTFACCYWTRLSSLSRSCKNVAYSANRSKSTRLHQLTLASMDAEIEGFNRNNRGCAIKKRANDFWRSAIWVSVET